MSSSIEKIFENNKSNIVEFDFKTMKMKINNKKYDSSWGEPHQHDDITYYDITKEIVMEFVCFSILNIFFKSLSLQLSDALPIFSSFVLKEVIFQRLDFT